LFLLFKILDHFSFLSKKLKKSATKNALMGSVISKLSKKETLIINNNRNINKQNEDLYEINNSELSMNAENVLFDKAIRIERNEIELQTATQNKQLISIIKTPKLKNDLKSDSTSSFNSKHKIRTKWKELIDTNNNENDLNTSNTINNTKTRNIKTVRFADSATKSDDTLNECFARAATTTDTNSIKNTSHQKTSIIFVQPKYINR
jgi:hypothetical protein